MEYRWAGICAAGLCAGAVSGLMGSGGGMVLLPLLSWLGGVRDEDAFASAVAVMLPITVAGLLPAFDRIPWREALPYLLGSAGGGTAAGLLGKKIPTSLLHRVLGVMIIWGGVRYLC